MSNYVQSTNFATKDALTSGDPLKIVKGTEINTEFVNISVAIATKADLASPTFTGTPSLPTSTTAVTQSASNNSTLLATTAFVQAVIEAQNPVGSLYFNATNSTNPATLLGFGTWTAFGAGRVMVGFDSGNALFDTAEETGGSADATLPSHTHTATSTVTDPSHDHVFSGGNAGGSPGTYYQASSGQPGPGTTYSSAGSIDNAVTGITVSTNINSTGTSGTNANYQPYITVYVWKRTA